MNSFRFAGILTFKCLFDNVTRENGGTYFKKIVSCFYVDNRKVSSLTSVISELTTNPPLILTENIPDCMYNNTQFQLYVHIFYADKTMP